ncbi:rRNA-binding ribosome biosynthesis protein [Dispira simplex]|nr:rRNA-binding ribosome biosynthesis protein [Dispira simplex]
MGKRKRTNNTKAAKAEEEAANNGRDNTPKSFVIRSGTVGKSVGALVNDFRRVMEPHTATRLKERLRNKFKDFVAMAGPLKVTHFVVFSRTDSGVNMRLARLPRGPTLTFRVHTYSLIKDVLKLSKHAHPPGAEYQTSPLVILNNFAGQDNHLRLMASTFQNMFPPIRVQNMKLSQARRVVLFNFNEEIGRVDFRQFLITVKAVGVSKSIKQVINANLPSLSHLEDISEFITRGAFASESDVEDGPESTVTLAQNYVGRNNRSAQQRAIRLQEIGPRLELQLLKIEAGMCEGEVLYHQYVTKTPKEIKQQKLDRQRKQEEAAKRRLEQEANVERKKALAEEHRRKTREGGLEGMRMKRALELAQQEAEESMADPDAADVDDLESDYSSGLEDASDWDQVDDLDPDQDDVRFALGEDDTRTNILN